MPPAFLPEPGQRYKFVVASAEEAATVIRERLGESARVISVRQVEGAGFARFLRSPKLEVIAELPTPEPAPPPPEDPPAAPPPARATVAPATSATATRIWVMLERAGVHPAFLARVRERPAWRSLPDLPLHTALARAATLLREASARQRLPLASRVAFFGPPGAGSTTALCKQLAADVFLAGRPACVMKLDGDEPNSAEELAVFCEALGVPLLRSPAELLEVPEDAAVYFDVPALPADGPALRQLGRWLDEFGVESRVLVANAAYETGLIKGAYERVRLLGGTHVVFTHLDELAGCAKLWEFLLEGSLQPLFGSTGPNLAADREGDLVDFVVRRTLAVGSMA